MPQDFVPLSRPPETVEQPALWFTFQGTKIALLNRADKPGLPACIQLDVRLDQTEAAEHEGSDDTDSRPDDDVGHQREDAGIDTRRVAEEIARVSKLHFRAGDGAELPASHAKVAVFVFAAGCSWTA